MLVFDSQRGSVKQPRQVIHPAMQHSSRQVAWIKEILIQDNRVIHQRDDQTSVGLDTQLIAAAQVNAHKASTCLSASVRIGQQHVEAATRLLSNEGEFGYRLWKPHMPRRPEEPEHLELPVRVPLLLPLQEVQSPHLHHGIARASEVWFDDDKPDGVPGAAHGPVHTQRAVIHHVHVLCRDPALPWQHDVLEIHGIIRASNQITARAVHDTLRKISPDSIALEQEHHVRLEAVGEGIGALTAFQLPRSIIAVVVEAVR